LFTQHNSVTLLTRKFYSGIAIFQRRNLNSFILDINHTLSRTRVLLSIW